MQLHIAITVGKDRTGPGYGKNILTQEQLFDRALTFAYIFLK